MESGIREQAGENQLSGATFPNQITTLYNEPVELYDALYSLLFLFTFMSL